jgi:hypothetical protein
MLLAMTTASFPCIPDWFEIIPLITAAFGGTEAIPPMMCDTLSSICHPVLISAEQHMGCPIPSDTLDGTANDDARPGKVHC